MKFFLFFETLVVKHFDNWRKQYLEKYFRKMLYKFVHFSTKTNLHIQTGNANNSEQMGFFLENQSLFHKRSGFL